MRFWARTLAASLLLVACRSGSGLRVEVDPCEASTNTSLGCRFSAAPPLHLADLSADLRGLPADQRERDGILVVNPGPGSVLAQALAVGGSLEEPKPLAEAVALEPGEATTVLLPTLDDDDGGMQSVQLVADAPVSATYFAPHQAFLGNDSALLLPVESLGTSYVAAAYAPHSGQYQSLGEPTFVHVTAASGATSVRWYHQDNATRAVFAGIDVAAGQWSPLLPLAANETLQITTAQGDARDGSEGDVSGIRVEAMSPVATSSGSRCSAVPATRDPYEGCDPLFEVLLPAHLWGTEYVVAPPPVQRIGAQRVRVYAGADDVRLSTTPPGLSGDDIVLAHRGDYVELEVLDGTNFILSGTGALLPVGYLLSRDREPQLGDPAMFQYISTDRYLERYVIACEASWSRHFVQFSRSRGAPAVRIDGTPVVGWEATGEYETVTVELPEGVHDLLSEAPFGAIQFGWTNDVRPACRPYSTFATCQTSYAHPAGLRVGD